MTDKPETGLRGEAAWKAEKQRISDRNDAAYARGREQRAGDDAKADDRRREAARREDAQLPEQPTP